MKTILSICLLVCGTSLSLQAQTLNNTMASVEHPKSIVTNSPDRSTTSRYTPATFKGGTRALLQYLSKTFVYTQADRENGFEGTIIVRCVVDATGQPEKAWVVQSVHPSIDERAKSVVMEMPTWQPGKRNGLPVSTTIDIPFELRLR